MNVRLFIGLSVFFHFYAVYLATLAYSLAR